MLNRRIFATTAALGSATLLGLAPRKSWASASAKTDMNAAHASLARIEATSQGRLGVFILDTATGQQVSYRADELFMLASSFKILASALVLARADRKEDDLERVVRYTASDLVPWSPITQNHAGADGMTLAQLCHATITTSDNTAANLILRSYGGPKALTQFMRSIGDQVTRLDRTEPQLNVPVKGQPLLDTTTPRAMALTMQKLLLGTVLSPKSRAQLAQWMADNTTGDKRLRAGVPGGWRVGDKTGTTKTDANDVAIITPPDRAPLLVTAYLAQSKAPMEVKEAALAEVGALVAQLGA